MKNLTRVLLGFFVSFCCLQSIAQELQKKLPVNEPDYHKPKLFADLPERIDFNPTNFLNLFELKVGDSANVPISSSFNFAGVVVSKSDNPGSSSVVIRSTNRLGARWIFTRVTDENNSTKYLGRIISFEHGDSYEIVSENNQYYFKKKGLYDLMNE